jgi:hypothetical protein
LVELKGVKFSTSPILLSQADRLNGLEDAFESRIEPTAVRLTSSLREDWLEWEDIKSAYRFRFVKVKGNWNVTSESAGLSETSGYLAKYPCDDVPGHPARLAREQAEQIRGQAEQVLVSQARQVSAVSFKCGPVRNASGYGDQSISVTDASVTGIDGLPDTAVAFIDAQYFSKFDADRIDGPGIWLSARQPYNPGGEWGFRFRGPSAEANRDACYQAIAGSYERWRSRFPTLAKLPPLSVEPSPELKRVLSCGAGFVGRWHGAFVDAGVEEKTPSVEVRVEVDGSNYRIIRKNIGDPDHSGLVFTATFDGFQLSAVGKPEDFYKREIPHLDVTPDGAFWFVDGVGSLKLKRQK